MNESKQRFPLMIVPQPAPSVMADSLSSDREIVDTGDGLDTAAPEPYLHLLPDIDGNQPGTPGAEKEIS